MSMLPPKPDRADPYGRAPPEAPYCLADPCRT